MAQVIMGCYRTLIRVPLWSAIVMLIGQEAQRIEKVRLEVGSFYATT